MTEPMINQSIETEEKVSSKKTIYDVGYGEIIFKNLVAGFSRALGNILIYVVFVAIALLLFIKYAYPQVEPFITDYKNAMKMITDLNKSNQKIQQIDPTQYNQLLDQFKQFAPKK